MLKYFKEHKRKVIILVITIVLGIALLAGCIFAICNISRSATVKSVATKGECDGVIVDTEENTEDSKETDTVKTTQETTEGYTSEKADEDSEEDTQPTYNEQNISSNVSDNTGTLKVSGTHLVDENDNIVQLKGISTHGIAWYPDYINSACFKQLHEEFGINVIRLALYTAEYNGYCTGGNKEYLKGLVDKGVQYATENHMYVIIDWHILSDGNPNTYIEESKNFFNEMSSKYASYTNVIYEICNEPNGGTSWNDIKNYATQIIDVIRKNDNDGVIIVGTPNWCQYVNEAAANPITGYDNIMYALHFYAATHKDDLRNTMVQAINSGLPIFVSEFGICDASGNGAIDETQANEWVSLMDKYGISYVMWNLSNKAETSAMIQSSCQKVNGFSVNDLSNSGKWFLNLSQVSNTQNSAQNNSTPSDSYADTSGQQGQHAGKITAKSDVKLMNTWEANGKKYYQYEVTVTNQSENSCGSWSTDIQFAGNIEISDSWNGTYTVNGSTLHIESAEYNGTLGAGETTGNIGFIISGNGNLK